VLLVLIDGDIDEITNKIKEINIETWDKLMIAEK